MCWNLHFVKEKDLHFISPQSRGINMAMGVKSRARRNSKDLACKIKWLATIGQRVPLPWGEIHRLSVLLSSTAYANSSTRGGLFFRACAAMAMVGLQGHWGERFGGTFLDDFSLRRACRATGESVLEEFLCFELVAALILARLQGHWGERFGGVFFDGFLARPKLYHHYHYGPQGRRSWPQDGSNAAVRQPTWRLDGCTCPQPGA